MITVPFYIRQKGLYQCPEKLLDELAHHWQKLSRYYVLEEWLCKREVDIIGAFISGTMYNNYAPSFYSGKDWVRPSLDRAKLFCFTAKMVFGASLPLHKDCDRPWLGLNHIVHPSIMQTAAMVVKGSGSHYNISHWSLRGPIKWAVKWDLVYKERRLQCLWWPIMSCHPWKSSFVTAFWFLRPHTYICTHIHMYTRTYIHTDIRTYVHTVIQTYTHTYHTNTFIHAIPAHFMVSSLQNSL